MKSKIFTLLLITFVGLWAWSAQVDVRASAAQTTLSDTGVNDNRVNHNSLNDNGAFGTVPKSTPSPKDGCSDKSIGIPTDECLALWSFYLSTNGSNWTQDNGWFAAKQVRAYETPSPLQPNPIDGNTRSVSSPDQNAFAIYPCQWYGVLCILDGDGKPHVSRLNLSWNNLQGTIPVDIADLTFLRVIDLAGNQLNGSIPAELGTLQELRTLVLSENSLAGEVPEELSNLNNLTVLHLFENQLLGDLPLSFTKLRNLQNFKFQNTNLCVPNDSQLEQWLDKIYLLTRTARTDCHPVNSTPKPLVLIYAVLDNDLGSEWERLVNNAEEGVRTGQFDVKLLIDGRPYNSYEYTLQQDNNASCPSLVTHNIDCNRYRFRQTLRFQVDDTAQRDSLSSFIINSMFEYPDASQVVLSLVGHGSGWGANSLPSQPKTWVGLSGSISDTNGGMLWDDTNGEGITKTQSLSTQALGAALRQVKAVTGKSIDLLYLDACSMAMVEVAYEVSNSVDYLLASENTKWATFPYQTLLPLVAGTQNGRTLGLQWMNAERTYLARAPGHAYTFSLVETARMGDVLSATNQLALVLSATLTSNITQTQKAFIQASRFDSNYDSIINAQDAYLDLADFARQVTRYLGDQPTVVSAAQAVQQAVAQAVVSTTFDVGATSSTTSTTSTIQWNQLGGLSIYLPLDHDEVKRRDLYNGLNLAWADQGSWDEWLAYYWQTLSNPTPSALQTCPSTSDCPGLNGWGSLEGPAQRLFLPIAIQ